MKGFANSKPWVTKRIKHMLNRKKKPYDDLKCIQKTLKTEIRKGKEYKRKIEENFKSSNMKRVWDGMKLMSGYKEKGGGGGAGQRIASADPDELNAFYARLDCYNFSQTRCELTD